MCRLREKFSESGWRSIFGAGLIALMTLGAGSALAQPANDNFANATDLSLIGTPGSLTNSNTGGTLEPGEPIIATVPGGASVWYVWTAPTNCIATFNTVGSDFDTLLGVYTGTSVSSLTLVVDDNNSGGVGGTSRVIFNAVAGAQYHIAVDGTNGAQGNLVLNWSIAPLVSAPANDNFADAQQIDASALWGSVSGTNTSATAEVNEPNHAGFPARNSVWYKWTAPVDGEVQLDTIGSTFDTVLAVYTGSAVGTLNQIAANDDLYPTYSRPGQGAIGQFNIVAQPFDTTNIPPPPEFLTIYQTNPVVPFIRIGMVGETVTQPFSGFPGSFAQGSGASGLRFNATAGTTYYFAVDGKFGFTGGFTLNWAYHSSGVLRFASENVDHTTGIPGMLLYQAAESESTGLRLNTRLNQNQFETTIHTDYGYQVPGVLVTITRVGGYSGRITVGYSTVDGTNISDHYSYDPTNDVVVPDGNPLTLQGDAPAAALTDYDPVSGTLTFDDFEMSKTIVIPIIDDFFIPRPNRDFAVVLFNPQRDPSESPLVSQPRVDPFYGQALVRILDNDADPRGPAVGLDVVTNFDPILQTNVVVTNALISLNSTNAIFNFMKANYRIPEDVADFWGNTPITVYVDRSGTNTGSASCLYRIDAPPLVDDLSLENEHFPLEPGSDYATPNTNGDIIGRAPVDFSGSASGSLSWGDKDFDPKAITFSVNNDTIPEFNEDFRIDLYEVVHDPNTHVRPVGMVSETTVTIMFDDEDPPAGSVDEFYNPDFGLDLVPPVNGNPVNTEPRNHPGTDPASQVNALVIQPDNKTIIGGNFQSYNGTPRNGITRIETNGEVDLSFDPGDGINIVGGDFIDALAVQPDGKILVGGSFTSFNGQTCGNIIRLNPDGSLDSSFAQVAGSGASGAVRSIVLRGNGRILIGGDFTSFNGTARKYVARLNSDGSVDPNYDPGTALNNSVYTMSSSPSSFNISATAPGNTNGTEFTLPVFVGAPSGVLTVDYNMFAAADDLRVYYGNTNTAAGTGVLIFDSGMVVGTNRIVVPFAPLNGLSANLITIVMDQGNTGDGIWNFTGTVQTFQGNLLTIGGDFTQAGGVIGQDHIARLLADGSLDLTFDSNAGANGRVRSIITQSDGKVVVGGDFTTVNGQAENHIVRLNTDGTVDTQFFSGTGLDGDVYDLNYVQGTNGPTSDTIYVGGPFSLCNGTHRLGFARLNYDGSLDTSFLDTAYNQFAGLPRVYWGDRLNAVYASALQSDGNVMIGGSFSTVGGGQFDPFVRPDSFDPNQYIEPKQRDGVRNRNNVARLIGGSTPGPGNIGLLSSTYPATKSQGFIYPLLTRTNGVLGYASANFQVAPGTAQAGLDYTYYAVPPMYPIMWEYIGPSWMHSDGLWGTNTVMNDAFGHLWGEGLNGMAGVIVSINNNQLTAGSTHAQFQLANPPSADSFYLGGQDIPLGLGLARSLAPLNIADDTRKPGTFGFTSPTYSSSSTAVISVTRTNGNFNANPILVDYATSPGSNTISGVDYLDTSGTLTFNNGETLKSFNVQIAQSNYISSVEKTVNLSLFNFPLGSSLGLTNAVLRIINPNFQGFLNFTATNYVTNLTAGAMQVTVTRTVGSKGTLDVQCMTADGTALAGTDYINTSTNLHWDNGDVSDRTVTIPLINDETIGGTKTFYANLVNPLLNGSSAPSLLGTITNTALTIQNDNNYGVFQFSSPNYVVNEASNGFATITVVRSGSTLGSATLDFATLDGTAVAGSNYVATNGTLSFVSGQAAATFNVRILADAIVDPLPFYFNVRLSNPSTGALLGSPTNSQVNILDAESFNRPPGSGDVTFNNPGINSDVLSVALQSDGGIIAGGNFTTVNGIPRGHLTRLLADGSLDTGFLDGLSGADKSVDTVAVQSDGKILLGGTFGTVDGVVRSRIARVGPDGALDTSFSPGSGADSTVFAVAEAFVGGVRKVYVGGAFTDFSSVPHPGIVRLNDNGIVDNAFTSTGVNGTVYAIAVYPTNSVFAGKILIGGQFTTVDGFARTNIARLNADGSLDSNFLAYADGAVRAIALQSDNAAVIGGEFADVNGITASRIARLNSDGSVDTAFASAVAPGVNDTVNAIAVQADNRILVCGQFLLANGLTRHHITRLLPSGAPDPTINFGDGANGDIDTVVVQPGNQMILIGGGFTQYNDNPAPYLERIYGGSATGSGAFEFTSAGYQVNENGLQAAITIRRVGGTSGPNPDGSGNTSVQFATTPGTAVPGVNYSTVNTSVSFPVGEVLETVFVPVIDDNVITSNKTVNLALSNPGAPAVLGDQTNAVLTIVNTDNSFSFSSPNFQVAKNVPTGAATITIVRNGGTTGSATVGFSTTTNGTAVIGTDYTPTNASVTFNPGDTFKTVLVGINNNGLPEGDRTVTMVMSNILNANVVDPSNAVLTIKDTTFSVGQLYLSSTNYFVNEGDGTATLTVIRSGGSSGTVSAFYYTTPVTATPGLNYITVSNSVSFADGQTNRTISVPLIDNNVSQGTEIFNVTLVTNINSGITLGYPSNASVFIADNDSGFSFLTATNKLLETAGPASVTVQRIGPTNSTASINYATHDGTALAGTNYTATSGTLTFTPGQVLKSIQIPVMDDPQVTGDLLFTVVLSTNSSSLGAQLAYPSTNTVIIQDADAGLSFTNSSMIVRRDAGFAVVTVVCSNPSIEPVIIDSNTVPLSVQYTTADGTAVGGVDYLPTSGTMLFTNGNGTNTFNVPIINNSSVVGDRTFNLRLFNPTLPGRLVAPSNETVTIVDANAGIRFSKPAYSVNKTESSALINVYRTGLTDTVATVSFAATNGSAIDGVNYYSTNGTLVFTNGVTNQTFSVQIIDTPAVQPNKTVLLQLLSPSNSVITAPGAATLTIRDNTGSYVVPAGSAIVSESGAGAPNGVIDSNETVTVLFGFRDAGGLNVDNLNATLIAGNGVTPSPNPQTQNYGPLISSSHSVSRPFTFTALGTNGQEVLATFQLQDGATNIGTAVFGYQLGSTVTMFTNAATILINDDAIASPYPSAINVSNVVGTVLKATITLTNLAHASPGDIDAVLVSPAQQTTLFMAHAGGQNSITNVTINFDDGAAAKLPQNGQIISGTNKPSAYLPVPVFP